MITDSKSKDSESHDAEPNSFHLFHQFPIEIRQKIWQDTFVPRAIDTFCSFDSHYPGPLPVVSRVNRESRAEVFRAYTPLITSPLWDDHPPEYINFALDTLVVEDFEDDVRMPARWWETRRVMFFRPWLAFSRDFDEVNQSQGKEAVRGLDKKIGRVLPRLEEVWNCFAFFGRDWLIDPKLGLGKNKAMEEAKQPFIGPMMPDPVQGVDYEVEEHPILGVIYNFKPSQSPQHVAYRYWVAARRVEVALLPREHCALAYEKLQKMHCEHKRNPLFIRTEIIQGPLRRLPGDDQTIKWKRLLWYKPGEDLNAARKRLMWAYVVDTNGNDMLRRKLPGASLLPKENLSELGMDLAA